MGKWKSALVSHSGMVYQHWSTDSHEELMSLFMLEGAKDKICKVSYVPTQNDYCDISGYRLHIEEDSPPDWWTDELQKSTEKALRDDVQQAIVADDRRVLHAGCYILAGVVRIGRILFGVRIIDGGCARVENGGSARVEYGNNMDVRNGQSMAVLNGGHMQVYCGDGMRVYRGGHMKVRYAHQMLVLRGQRMHVEFGGGMIVQNAGRMTIRFGDRMALHRGEHATIGSGCRMTVQHGDYASVEGGKHMFVQHGGYMHVQKVENMMIAHGEDATVGVNETRAVNDRNETAVGNIGLVKTIYTLSDEEV